MDQPATDRTLAQRLVDWQWAKYSRLPDATTSYTVTRDLRVPMRDGVELLADIYEPKSTVSGTILVTSPYGWNLVGAAMTGGVFVGRGYRVVLVRCRGTFGSGGTFDPFRQEAADGADVVGWMRTQPWFDGRFATYGYSYCGYTQWALLTDPPPELVTAVIACAPQDWGAFLYTGGAFLLSTAFEWSFVTTKQEEPTPRRMYDVLSAKGPVTKALNGLPLTETGEGLLGGKAPWYPEWVSRRDPDDSWWQPANLTQALENTQIPVLLQGGWQDGFLRPTMAAYHRLTDRGIPAGLTIGPWTHAQGGTQGTRILLPEALAWFDQHLAGTNKHARPTPVNVFVGGHQPEWRNLSSWPPPTTQQVLWPNPGNVLNDHPATPGETAEFTYNPADPTPTYGGAFVTQISPGLTAGYTDDTALAVRPDVLAFTTAPLPETLEAIGTPVVEIGHSTDNPHADLFIRLCEVDPKGRSHNISDGFTRLDPSKADDIVRLELDPIAHRFTPGNQIRLIIAGGSHPRWERNLGTGDEPATSTTMRPSHRTIDLSKTQLTIPNTGAKDA